MDAAALSKTKSEALLNTGRPVVKRQDTVPNKLLVNPPPSGRNHRRGSQPENGARSAKLTNGSSKVAPNGSTGPRFDSHLNLPSRPATTSKQSSAAATGQHSSAAGKVAPQAATHANHREPPITPKSASARKPPEFGKGRLERGKQISHLGLFPDSDKRMQRQSTSMNAEAGDHPANLEDVISPNPQDKKHSLQWRQQVDHIARSLIDYAESHPYFSSQLTSCRLENIIQLKTTKPIKGDELTLNVTFAITPLMFDFRSAGSVKGHSAARTLTQSSEGSLEGKTMQQQQSIACTATPSNSLESPSRETLLDQENL